MSNENWRVGFEYGSVTADAVVRNPGWTPVVGDCPPFAFGGVVALVDQEKNAPLIAAAPELLRVLKCIMDEVGGSSILSIATKHQAAAVLARIETPNDSQ